MIATTELQLHEVTFRAFGSNCRIVSDVQRSVPNAVHRLEDLESRWSRFVPTSEVSLVNNSAGRWVEISAITTLLFERANEAARRTSGVFNPTLLDRLCALGYNVSNESLDLETGAADSPLANSGDDRPHAIALVDVADGAARRPAGGFDPGGLGKGLAADLVLADLLDDGASWAMVSLGGDIRFGGAALEATGWTVHIDDPRTDGFWGMTRVHRGALATSSTASRRWRHDGVVAHHLLDPTTEQPADSGRLAATVWGPEAWWADVVAKALVIDPAIGQTELDQWSCEALVFLPDEVEVFGLAAQAAP